MSITPLKSEPASIIAGDTISWQIALPDYPVTAGWTLKYNAVGAAGQFALDSSAAGADHAVAAAKGTTAAYPVGNYTVTKYVESATERVTLGNFPLQVLPDLAAKTAAFDNRSHAKRVLDAIEAVLEGTASSDQQEFTIDGTTLKRKTVADLLKLRQFYKNEYDREVSAARIQQGLGPGNKVLVRFR